MTNASKRAEYLEQQVCSIWSLPDFLLKISCNGCFWPPSCPTAQPWITSSRLRVAVLCGTEPTGRLHQQLVVSRTDEHGKLKLGTAAVSGQHAIKTADPYTEIGSFSEITQCMDVAGSAATAYRCGSDTCFMPAIRQRKCHNARVARVKRQGVDLMPCNKASRPRDSDVAPYAMGYMARSRTGMFILHVLC